MKITVDVQRQCYYVRGKKYAMVVLRLRGAKKDRLNSALSVELKPSCPKSNNTNKYYIDNKRNWLFGVTDGVMSVIAMLKIIIYSARKTRIQYHTCNYRQFALFVLSHAFRRRLGLFYIDQKDTRNQAQACVGPNLTREKIEHRFLIPTVRYNVASLTVL